MKTLVVIGSALRIHEERILSHGAELPPGTLTENEISQWLDQGRLEQIDRRSLYALFPEFSGSPTTFEPMPDELAVFTLAGVT